MTDETIYALASGRGRTAVALFRVSGPQTRHVLATMAGGVPPARTATLRTIMDPAEAMPIDRGLVLYFPAPASFTGEDCAEFHLHGGPAVVTAFCRAIDRCGGVRPAEAGEFTRRAFLNGKLGLDQVEGLGDLIEAETEQQRRQALSFARGRMGGHAAEWRHALLEAAALLAADIDFSDEGDVSQLDRARVREKTVSVLASLQAELARGRAGERLRDGLSVVIAGPPNAGKSTLLNALAGREAAIVSPIPGTTRDLVEVALDLGGFAVSLVDTAGLRDSDDPIEQLGVERARRRTAEADLVLWLSEAACPMPVDASLVDEGTPVWRLFTKGDLLAPGEEKAVLDGLVISVAAGRSLNELMERLENFAVGATAAGENALITRERHRRLFERAAKALSRIEELPDAPVELLAEDLRTAMQALDSLIGKVDVEDVLGDIFVRFCIGK